MATRHDKNEDLHGNVPDCCPVALLLVDVLNDLDFPGNAALLKAAPTLATNISRLKNRCRENKIPVVYVNDNRDKWRSDLPVILSHSLRLDSPGRRMVEKLIPDSADYIVLKPKHSAFFATPLDTLISYLKTKTVILTGLTTSSCILMTAGELYVRDLNVFVPSDCVAALRKTDHRKALDLMRTSFQADTTPSKNLNLNKLLRDKRR
jgi:nicotinamidase-related amidase